MAFKLERFENRPVQAYFSNTVQLADVIASILEHIGAAEIVISTFSTSEEFLRRIWRLRKEGLITSASLFCDFKAARKTVHLYKFIISSSPELYNQLAQGFALMQDKSLPIDGLL